jgi:hypothetical protein
MSPRRDPDPWLNREEQAALLGVGADTITQYVRRYGPDHPNPYPTHIDNPGTRKQFGRSTAVRQSALTAWNDRRTGSKGRPRLRPETLTPAQHTALARSAAGDEMAPRHAIALLNAGMIEHDGTRFVLTRAGRDTITAYPDPRWKA